MPHFRIANCQTVAPIAGTTLSLSDADVTALSISGHTTVDRRVHFFFFFFFFFFFSPAVVAH